MIYYILYANVRFLESDDGVMVMFVYVLVLRRYDTEILRVKVHEVCSLFADDLTILETYTHTDKTHVKKCWHGESG